MEPAVWCPVQKALIFMSLVNPGDKWQSIPAALETYYCLLVQGSRTRFDTWEKAWLLHIHSFIWYKWPQHRVPSWFSNTLAEVGESVTTCSYLGVLEESRDASDVQTETSRGASRSVNTGCEERVVLLLCAHAPRAQQRCNPQTQGHAHAHAPGKHGPALVSFYPTTDRTILRAGSAGETKETSIMHWGGVTGSQHPAIGRSRREWQARGELRQVGCCRDHAHCSSSRLSRQQSVGMRKVSSGDHN